MIPIKAARLIKALPRGGSFSETEWAVRHGWIVMLLWAAVPGIVGFAILRSEPVLHALAGSAFVAVAAGVARWAPLRRAGRSAASALGLSAAAAVVVHVWGGAIEAHFLFFVVVAVLSLYQDWVPFLVALAFVLIHHGVVGTLAPEAVYNHPDAVADPWRWAAIHAGLVLMASTANVIAWCRSEQAARAARHSYRCLRDSEERFRSHFADAAVGQAMALPDGTIIAGNNKFMQICGYDGADLPGLDIPRLTHPDDRERTRVQLERLLAGEVASYDIEKRILRRDGGEVHVLLSVSLARDDHGAPRLITAIVQDLTQRRQAEEARRRAEVRFSDLVDAAPVAVVEYDLDGGISTWNPEAKRMFGWATEEVRGLSPTVPDDLVPEFQSMCRAAARGERFVVESRRLRRDGAELEVSIAGGPVLDDGGRVSGLLCVLSDVGGRRRLEEELRQAQKMEAVGRLAGGVAHDFNNLLTVITGYCELALGEVDRDGPASVAGYLRPVRDASQRAARLTRQLLTFSRGQPWLNEPLDLAKLVTSLRDMLGRLLGDNIELQARLPGNGSAVVMADKSQLEQVVMNLVVNARDAMPGGGRIVIEVTSGGASGQPAGTRSVALAVSDDGEGMDDATRRQVFEPFFTTKKAGAGTGLGLSTVYGVAERAGGSVSVTSAPGRGSTFTVVLPAFKGDARDDEEEEEVDLQSVSVGATVLLVEDQGEVRSLALDVLQKHGYTVLEARDAAEAVSLLDSYSGRVDLLLSDVSLPGQSGPELAELVSAGRTGIKVLFISGCAPELRGQAAVELLEKPYTSAQLLHRVRTLLDRVAGAGRSPALNIP